MYTYVYRCQFTYESKGKTFILLDGGAFGTFHIARVILNGLLPSAWGLMNSSDVGWKMWSLNKE